jgi:hypothetical protein
MRRQRSNSVKDAPNGKSGFNTQCDDNRGTLYDCYLDSACLSGYLGWQSFPCRAQNYLLEFLIHVH